MAVSERAEEKRVGFTPNLVINQPSHYCPGCHYGILTRILAEVIQELGIAGDIIGVSAVGCNMGENAIPHGRHYWGFSRGV